LLLWWGGRPSPLLLTVGAIIWLATAALAGLVWRRLHALPRRTERAVSVLEEWEPRAQPVGTLEGGTALFSQAAEEEQRAWLQSRFRERARQLLGLLKQAIPQARSCALFLYQPVDDRLRLELCVGGATRDYREALLITVGHGAIGWAAKERKPCLYARLDPQRQRPDYYQADAAIRSLLVVPFLRGERLEGVLCVDSAKAESLGDREEELLTLATGCLQAQLEDVRQQGAIVRQTQHFSMLHAASQSLNSGLDLQRRLEAMTEMAQKIVQSDISMLCLVESGERKAVIRVVRGEMEPCLGQSFGLTDGLVCLVVKNRQPILLSRLPDEQPTRFFPIKSKIRLTARSFLGLPLILQDRVIGLLICTADQPSAFTALHQHLLSILCNQAAQAIADAQLHAEVERLAAVDGLTGMYNYREFHERLHYEWEQAQRHGESLALMMIDLDHFKRVNDTYGHQTGDRILKQVAALLSRLARKVDTVGRYGGEEFAILLPKTTAQQAGKMAERIRKVVERHPFGLEGVGVPVTLSIGVASAPADATGQDHLVSVADKALYRAKEQGRNRTVLYADLVSAMARME
jgi:diguanylate cyclase (GGDEF)-like protein